MDTVVDDAKAAAESVRPGLTPTPMEHKPPPAAWWQVLIEVLGAMLIAYSFIVVMMTASAQQRVTALLDAHKAAPGGEQADYSTAWAYLVEAEGIKGDEAADRKALALDLSVQQTAAAAVSSATDVANDAWDQFVSSGGRPVLAQACGQSLPTAKAMPDRVQFWNAMWGCRVNLDPKQLAQLSEGMIGSADFGKAFNLLRAASQKLAAANTVVDQITAKLAKEDERLAKLEAYRSDFSEMNILINNWALGHGLFVPVPPSMIQILLSFFSGMFGALLITLVLVVYPQSALSAGQTTQHASRIFLGGLIAVCVFIVLSGGSAILGSQSSFSQAHANFMTFAAVGILAGMFSDRVALWLSSRANAFFADPSRKAAAPGGSARAG